MNIDLTGGLGILPRLALSLPPFFIFSLISLDSKIVAFFFRNRLFSVLVGSECRHKFLAALGVVVRVDAYSFL